MSWKNKLKTLTSKWFYTKDEVNGLIESGDISSSNIDYLIDNNPDIILHLTNQTNGLIKFEGTYPLRVIENTGAFTIGLAIQSISDYYSIATMEGENLLYINIDYNNGAWDVRVVDSVSDPIIDETGLTWEEMLNLDYTFYLDKITFQQEI